MAQSPDGRFSSLKLLSEDPRIDDAALEGIRRILGLPSNSAIPPELLAELRVGTTVATNALLERRGEPVVLVTTRGFRDQLRIGYQNRPKLFVLKIELPEPLYARVIEAGVLNGLMPPARCLHPLDEETLRRDLSAVARGRDSSDARFCSCTAIIIPRT